MLYTWSVETERFEELARELAAQHPGLAAELAEVHEAAEHLRDLAHAMLEAFKRVARAADAEYLTQLEVGPVEPDEKHVDCIQFRVARGRWEFMCVVKAKKTVTLVGPFCRGKPEKPCSDHPLRGEQVERALEDLLAHLIRAASE